MRRDYFELDVQNVDWVGEDGEPKKPFVRIDFHGPERLLREQLADVDEGDGELLEAENVDVSFRLLETHDNDPDAEGVVSVTNRLTGDFVFELNATAGDVLQFIRAAREYGRSADSDGQYRIEIDFEGSPLVEYEKDTFLVYDADGNLLRRESLIPSGIEL
ncbi:hypothetical protein AArcSl_0368 [Halalkaliarchaeum desulfuricum]|uniref:Uncharacterized protein n=1 Tax=Halalkaliarchaeum desulfuricum TaxID=2055893 RepID=A0A343TFZ9_9EURY|nr:DUF5793 family protein [Halalkaliarchaeum desulfuricum]AUX08021.1 hypothetical protein AArcSl_0368 [Halalkaliarchaeum desulfuricum]